MDSEESHADANPLTKPVSESGEKPNDSVSINTFDPNELYYNMSGEKYLLIFNHRSYQNTIAFRNTRPNERKGTEEDVDRLKTIFGKMNFKVFIHNDSDYDSIMKIVKNVSNEDHSNTACLCIVILTHGDKNEELYAADMPYNLRDITVKLENGHAGLVGKPKLFFIQACRGDNLDAGRKLQLDSSASSMVLPSTADFFFLRSSVEGYLSFRNAYGSFMIQELCKAIEEYHHDKDIHFITTLVNRSVAYHYSTYTPDVKKTNNKKQMPEVRHTLTKIFKF